MTVNVGVIGVGMIGKDHIRRLTTVLAGAAVVAVTDVNLDEAKKVADGIPGATGYSTGQELIIDDDVDAVLVLLLGSDPRGVRAGGHRGRQTGLLREAVGHHARRPACGSSTPRSPSVAGWSRSATCAATTRTTGRSRPSWTAARSARR